MGSFDVIFNLNLIYTSFHFDSILISFKSSGSGFPKC